jgi:hypothetical protein
LASLSGAAVRLQVGIGSFESSICEFILFCGKGDATKKSETETEKRTDSNGF